MKKITQFFSSFIKTLAFLLFIYIFVINLLWSSIIQYVAENTHIYFNSFIIWFIFSIFAILYFLLHKYLQKIDEKKAKIICAISLGLFLAINIFWIFYSKAVPVYDCASIESLAKLFAKGDFTAIKKDIYIERYPYQIGVVTFFGVLYKIFHTTDFMLLKVINVVSNIFLLIGFHRIGRELTGKKYVPSIFITGLLFIPITLYNTFIYGDFIGLTFAVWSIYFAIRFRKEDKKRDFILSILLCMFAFFIKINYSIFMIALLLYYFFYLNKKVMVK